MKKTASLVFVFVCISVFLLGCSKMKCGDKPLNFSFDKNGNYTGFSDLPANYTIEEAKNDGYYVTQDLKDIANKDEWDKFIEASSHKKNASIRILMFYKSSSNGPYFLDLFYNDGYYYLFDSSAENQKKQPFLYLLTLKGHFGSTSKDSITVVLANEDTLTFDMVMGSLISSNMNYIKSIPPFKLVMFK